MSTLVPFHNIYRSTAADSENAPDLVLLHGWGLHSIVWDDVMPGLLAHFRVTVIDLPGMGQSPLPAGDYDLDLLLSQIESVLPARCHVLGWSLGGLVATALAARLPDRVLSLVTVATSPRFVSTEGWPAAMASAVLEKFIDVFDEDMEGTLIRFLALNCKDAETMRDDVRKLREILYFCGLPARRALRGGLEVLRDTDLRSVVAGLQLPILMMFGERDNIVPAAVADDVSRINSGVQLALLREVAHVPFVSAPDVFLSALTDFYHGAGVIDG